MIALKVSDNIFDPTNKQESIAPTILKSQVTFFSLVKGKVYWIMLVLVTSFVNLNFFLKIKNIFVMITLIFSHFYYDSVKQNLHKIRIQLMHVRFYRLCICTMILITLKYYIFTSSFVYWVVFLFFFTPCLKWITECSLYSRYHYLFRYN